MHRKLVPWISTSFRLMIVDTHAYREFVNKELDRLVRQGISTPVPFVDWAVPIIQVLKSDKKSIRI